MVLSAFPLVLVNAGVVFTSSPFTKLADPTGGLPPGQVRGVAFSHDSIYLAVASTSTSTYITIYKRSGDTFTKLTNLTSSVPNDYGKGVDFSTDSTYMAVSHEKTPFVTVYKKSGDTFTRLPDPVGGLPTGLGRGVDFSPDSNYMAVAHQNSPYITIYRRSGDTFTKLANPVDLPTAQGRWVAFSPDSTQVATIYDAAPYIAIYKLSGGTFTRLPNPALSGVRDGGGISFSPDSAYMAVAHHDFPYMTIFSRSGDTFTKVNDPEFMPAAQGRGVSFSPNSPHLALGSDDNPYIRIYKYAQLPPTITAVNPAGGIQGETLNVVITGNVFFGVMPANFGPGITINSVTVNSPTQVTVNISIAVNAAAGAHDVSVTTPGGTATLAAAFTVIQLNQGIGTGSHSSTVSVTAPIITTPPVINPVLQTQSASLSAKTVTPGTPVTVTADIANRSAVNGNKKVTLYVNGQVESAQAVTVNSGGSSQLIFSVSRSEPGDYSVYVDGVPAGSFKVEMVTATDSILIFSAALVALAILIGIVMLLRRQRTSHG